MKPSNIAIYIFSFTYAEAYFRFLLFIGYPLTAITVAFFATIFVRYVIRRPRPHFENAEYVPWLKAYSFPSAHASIAFSWGVSICFLLLFVINAPFVWVFVAFVMIFAGLIAISRLFVGVHYVSDIIVGSLLGTVVSVTILTL